MWKNGKFEGTGHLSWENYTYEGNFSAGKFEGHGKLTFKQGTYTGKFK